MGLPITPKPYFGQGNEGKADPHKGVWILYFPKKNEEYEDMLNMAKSNFEKEPEQIVNNEPAGIKEGVARDPMTVIMSLIDAANNAYEQAAAEQDGDTTPLQDKQGNMYGLSGKIRLDGRGYITFPFVSAFKWGDYTPQKIKVLTRAGGKVRIFNGDYDTEGWKDAKKLLNNIISHASIGNAYFKNYDPNLENQGKEGEEALKQMNKQIGRGAKTGMEYINEIVSNTIKKHFKK